MRTLKPAALCALFLVPMASTAHAGHIVAAFSGLVSPDVLEDFGANLFPNFTPITNQFPPLVFTHTAYFTTGTSNNLVGGFLTNDFSGAPNTLRIEFNQQLTDVSFVYHQISTAMPSNFRVLLNGSVVDSFSNTSDQFQPNNYFGFTDGLFDELELDFVSDFNIDTLAYNLSGGAGTATCFGDGSGTACPCLNNGGLGEGCANGTGAGGVLSASGTASVSADSLSLTADGVINNNGLFFQGNNTIGGGAGSVFGDGLRCCGGSVVRIQVVNPPGTASPATAQMTETATTNGPPGTITAGTKKCYQYWYRDPSTSPCGTQFNLTNAVSITWQP